MLHWLIVVMVVVSIPLTTAHPFPVVAPRAACGYDSCALVTSDKLNVHLIPHTHDDLGWLKTVDQLYFGSRSDLQRAGVQYILDSVISELLVDPARRFIYVETAFLSRWWDEQTEEKRDVVRGLVDSGQLEITNGAWSMNDEAVAHYQSIIDNFSWGFKVLNESLGECGRPTVGWQIDPFGHSREHASISARMGFDGLFFARLDFQDRRKRLADKTAEMIWRGSPDNLGDVSEIFTHAFESAYSPPPGFCFDVNCGDDPMIDDTSSPEYNIPERVRAFSDHVKNKATKYRSNNVLLTMGDDFNYQDANVWYKNLDKLIKYVNADTDSNMNVIYSTPACYLKAVNDEGLSWPEKSDDFFPYGTDPGAYWVGFFTAKPTIKYFERLGNNFLQVSKQLLTLAVLTGYDEAGLTELREAMGLMQHHDAITGTMKDFVAQDYYRILDKALAASRNSAELAINKLIGNPEPTLVPFWSCLKLNISECAATESADDFVITVYNPLSWSTSAYIRVPVTSLDLYVQHPNGSEIQTEIIDLPAPVLRIPGRNSLATQELVFRADSLPPLGFQSFYVTQLSRSSGEVPETKPATRATTIGNSQVIVNIDDNGLTQSISINGIDVSLVQTFEYYIGTNKEGELMSGAYIFRPNGTSTVDMPITSFSVIRTPLVEEIHQEFGDGWVSQVIRVYAGENNVEFEWTVGPIPDEDNVPKDVLLKFATDLATDGTFYTDSNGRELLKRVRNFRPTWDIELSEPETIAANYYPIVSKLLVRDEAKGLEVAVLVDRAQGGSSIHDGEIEFMLHRRLFRDDGFEPLNEVAYGQGLVVRGKHWLVAGPIGGESTTAVQERQLQASKLLKPWTFISPTNGLSQSEWAEKYNIEYSGLTGNGLPANVQILTLEPWTQNTLLLRLEHILEVNEDAQLSQPAVVDLTTTFVHLEINSAVETTLGGIQPIDELNRLQWNSEVNRVRTPKENKALDITSVTLNPMEIRTFVVDYVHVS